MLSPTNFAVLLGIVSLASGYDQAYDHDPAPLKYEHPGDLFHGVSGTCCATGVLTGVNSTGEIRSVNGSMSPPYRQFGNRLMTNA